MIKIPRPEEVQQLFEEFHTPLRVRAHCEVVAKCAVWIAEKLVRAGVTVNIELARSSALLHDLVRVVDFRVFDPKKLPQKMSAEGVAVCLKLREQYRGLHHAEAGADILQKKGWPEVAEVVLKHRFLQIETGFDSWEEKIVYYADKRVKHDQVVSLAERLEDGRKRNNPDTLGTASAKKLDEKVFALEREICLAGGFRAEDLGNLWKMSS